MKYKKLLIILYIFLSLNTLQGFGQDNGQKDQCQILLKSATELYNGDKFGSALHEFQKLKAMVEPGSLYADEADYHISVCYLEMGNQNGKSLLEAFILNHPESPRISSAWFKIGDIDFEQKQYKQALVAFRKVDRFALKGKELDEYCFKSGFCNLQSGSNDVAKVFFADLKDKSGTFSDAARYYWAHIAYLEGKYDPALQEFGKIENTAQYSVIVPYYKAQIYFALGKYDEVIALGPALIEKATPQRKVELARIIGVSYYQLKFYKEALPFVEIYLKDKDLTPLQYYVAGYCYGKTGNPSKAIANLEKATKGKDALAQNAWYELASLYIKKDDKQRAMVAFQNASSLKFDPKIREDALFQYAKITYELDYSPFNEAIKAFDQYISEYPNSDKNDVAYDYLVKVYMNTRNYKDALVSLDKIKIKNPSIKKVYQKVAMNRGIELFRDLKFDDAITMFNKSLDYGDQNLQLKALAWYWRGDASYRLGKNELAMADYRRFQAIQGSNKLKEFAISNYNIGYLYFNQELYDQAITWFTKCCEALKDNNSSIRTDAYNRLGDCYFVNSKFSDASKNYQNAYESGGSDADYALYEKAFCAGLLFDYNLKITELEKLQQQFPQSNYIDDAIFETAKSWERLKNDNKAIEVYQSLISRFPDSPYKPKSLNQLGLIYYNRNDYDASVKFYKQVVERYPNSQEAKGALGGIRNSFVENNKVDEYIAYTKKLGQTATPSENEQDSLTYFAAEKLYMNKDPKADEALQKYLESFPTGGFTLNVHFYRGEAELAENKLEESLSDYDFVLLQADNIFTENALLKASELAFKTGDYKKSLGYYERLETASNTNNNLLISLTGRLRCFWELKDYSNVSKIGWKIRSMDKIPVELDREASYKSARASIELGESLKALPLWRKLSSDTKSLEGAEAKYRICENYLATNKLKEAENEIMDFIDKNTPHQYWLAKSFILLAHVYEKQNDLFQATHTLQSTIENYNQKDDGIIDEAKQYLQELEAKDNSAKEPVETKAPATTKPQSQKSKSAK